MIKRERERESLTETETGGTRLEKGGRERERITVQSNLILLCSPTARYRTRWTAHSEGRRGRRERGKEREREKSTCKRAPKASGAARARRRGR